MRILGEHFTAAGKPKRKFPSKKAAEKFMIERAMDAEAYHCSFCLKWHLASGSRDA